MTMSLSTYRALFPVTEKLVYLNNAAESPLNTRVRQQLEGYLKLAAEEPQNKPEVRTIVRKQLSEIFGGTVDDYALVTSTGIGIGIVASGYQWQKGDNVVVPMDEHWNNTFPWLALLGWNASRYLASVLGLIGKRSIKSYFCRAETIGPLLSSIAIAMRPPNRRCRSFTQVSIASAQ